MKANLFIEAIATITSLGIGKEEAFQNLQLKPRIQSFKINETLEFPISQISEFQNNNFNDQAFLFADKALNEIEQQIKVKLKELDKTAILVGCTKGESFSISQQLQKKEPDFQTYLAASSNLINTKLSQKYQLPFIPVSSAACATGAQVIQKASLLLEENKFEKILLCMTEASLTPEMIGAFSQLGVLTKEPNGTAPFDSNHQGFHMGEGAVALLFSKNKSNNNQGKILGAISTTDANHFTTFPNGPQLVWESIQKLCISCGIKINEIDHVNLHGTGTQANDAMETTLANLLIQANPEISFSALKPYTGHLLGASGLSEFALTLICAQKGWVPPILNNKATNITLPTQFVREPKGRHKQITYFITLSYGLGSTIGVILGKNA